MAANKRTAGKKYFTPAEANAALPLVRAIIRDITELAHDLQERHERLSRLRPHKATEAHQEEMQQAVAEFERDQERMLEYQQELSNLGVELKDYTIGLVDFPCWVGDREVYLCWRQGEAQVAFWHEVDAGFAGRRGLDTLAARSEKSGAGA